MHSPGSLAAALASLAVAACLPSSRTSVDDPAFAVVCSSQDATCASDDEQAALPATVALDSSLRVLFIGEQVTQSSISVRPASPRMALVDGPAIRFTAPGHCALLARSEAGTVVSLQHVSVAAVHDLELLAPEALAPGEPAELVATPRDAQGLPLAGSLDYSWTTSDPAVAAIDTSAKGHRVNVLGVGPGTTTIRASAGGVEASLLLTVKGSP